MSKSNSKYKSCSISENLNVLRSLAFLPSIRVPSYLLLWLLCCFYFLSCSLILNGCTDDKLDSNAENNKKSPLKAIGRDSRSNEPTDEEDEDKEDQEEPTRKKSLPACEIRGDNKKNNLVFYSSLDKQEFGSVSRVSVNKKQQKQAQKDQQKWYDDKDGQGNNGGYSGPQVPASQDSAVYDSIRLECKGKKFSRDKKVYEGDLKDNQVQPSRICRVVLRRIIGAWSINNRNLAGLVDAECQSKVGPRRLRLVRVQKNF